MAQILYAGTEPDISIPYTATQNSYAGSTQVWRVGSTGIYNETSGSSTNANITSTPTLRRNSSSIKYKIDVEDLTDEEANVVFDLRPVTYKSLCTHDPETVRYLGFIAEEVANLDPSLVIWLTRKPTGEFDEDGIPIFEDIIPPDPDGFTYDKLSVLLQKIIKRQNDQINSLEVEINDLIAEINNLKQQP